MSTVRIDVSGGSLGDVEVRVDDGIGYLDGAAQQDLIDRLLSEAVSKVRRAYDTYGSAEDAVSVKALSYRLSEAFDVENIDLPIAKIDGVARRLWAAGIVSVTP